MATKIAFHIAALLAAIMLAPGSASAKGDRVTVAIGGNTLIYLPAYVAKEMHYFEDNGIDGDYISVAGGATGVAAVISGGAQLYLGLPSIAMKAIKQGQKLVSIGTVMDKAPLSCVLQKEVVERKGITDKMPIEDRIRAFKGLTFGINAAGSAPDEFTRYAVQSVGLQPDRDITIAPAGTDATAIIASFQQKRIDGICFSSPVTDTAVAKFGGIKVVDFTAGDFAPVRTFPYLHLIARADWATSDPDRTMRVVKAFAQAMKFILGEPDKARAIARKMFASLDEASFEAMFQSNQAAYSPTLRIDPAAMESGRNFARAEDHIDLDDAELKQVYTNRYVDAAGLP